MKTQASRRPRGFTLVELLVVIAIIAVLAGAGFAAGQAAINKARRLKAQTTVTSLEAAVRNFYTEYGSLPDITGKSEIDTSQDRELLTILLGMETADPAQNTRKVKMLEVKEGKSNKDGLIYSADKNSVVGLYDPWGNGYIVYLDTEYDEKLEFTPRSTNTSVTLIGKRVAVYSPGVPQGEEITNATLIKTW